VLGVFVIAGMLFLLGLFGSKFDPLGFGLTGTSGALTFLGIAAALAAGVILTYRLIPRRGLDAWLLRRRVIGPCMLAFAQQRFSLALQMTSGTGMPIGKAVELSLRATGNEAFMAAATAIVAWLEKGDELTRSLARGGVFSEEYLDMLAGAEESGRLDDVLEHQANYYAEESERRLTALTKAIGAAIWVLIGAILVFFIFRIASTYINLINRAV
jgi:type II secretory pathway component PulF